MTELQLIARRQKYETSHVLHLLLTLLTGGLWILPWIMIAISNGVERRKVDSKLKKYNKD